MDLFFKIFIVASFILLFKFLLAIFKSHLEKLVTRRQGLSEDEKEIEDWNSLPSLATLVMGLPKDAWIAKVSNHDDSEYIVELTRPLLNAEAHRCKKHASYVRFLGYESRLSQVQKWKRFELDPAVFDAFEILGIFPFPNVHSYRLRTLAEFSTFNRITGPRIYELIFDCSGNKMNPESLTSHRRPRLNNVVPLPLSLRVLRLKGSEFPEMISASLMYALKRDSHLETIHLPKCGVLEKSDFPTLLSSKTAQDLDLGMLKAEYLSFVPVATSQRLSSLNATVCNLRHCCELLEKIGKSGTSQLHTLRVTYNIYNPVDMQSPIPILKDFFDRLWSLRVTDVLTEVSVSLHLYSELYASDKLHVNPEREIENLNNDVKNIISSLLLLKNIQKVYIRLKWNEASAFHCYFRLESISDKIMKVVISTNWLDIKSRSSSPSQKQTVIVNFSEDGSAHKVFVKE